MKQAVKRLMNPTLAALQSVETSNLLNIAFARTGAAFSSRICDNTNPRTWESSGFSQNGEDGIFDFLISQLRSSNKYFVEIGSNNGIENNTAYLAHVKKFSGLQVEGDAAVHEKALQTKAWLVDCLNCFVTDSTTDLILEKCSFKNPDVFSIDIDGMDYYITKLLFEKGLRPKIVAVEYNSAFGPTRSMTLKYQESFNMFTTPFPYLYYGVSIAGWKTFFNHYGYKFITVESNGVNGFFVDPAEFDEVFLSQVSGTAFEENRHQLRVFKELHEKQFQRIKHLEFAEIL